MSGLILIQTINHSDGISKKNLKDDLKKISADDKKHEKLPSMQRVKHESIYNLGLTTCDRVCDIILSCPPRVTVTSCFVYKVVRALWSRDYLCINPIRLIHK